MKNYILILSLFACICGTNAETKEKIKFNKDRSMLRGLALEAEPAPAEEAAEAFKPSINVGAIIHMYAGSQQEGYAFGGDPTSADASKWQNDFTVYRSRIMLGAQLSEKGSFFMETELSSSANGSQGEDGKSIKIQPMILDCQYEYKFDEAFTVIAGMQLVSHNRNGLQGAAGLLANDFTYFQYANNMAPTSPLQNNLGRDLGVNFRGLVLDEKLEYRLGFFSGRTSFDGESKSPLRTVARVAYNIFDADKSYYYNGTNLGNGKTLSIAGGLDHQGSYNAVGLDVFTDLPMGTAGSFTGTLAFSSITAGDIDDDYSFADPSTSYQIYDQTSIHAELGYYHKESKLQPWLRFEQQKLTDADVTTNVIGGGVNYWFNAYNTNLRASYTSAQVGDNDAYGQFWLQVQLFIF